MVWGRRPPSRWSCSTALGNALMVSSETTSALSSDEVGAERRQADRDVVGALGPARVADPLARLGEDGLAGPHVGRTALVVDDDLTAEDDGDLVELRCLERLVPSRRGDHVRDGHRLVAGVDASDVLVDDLAAGHGDPGGFADESWHRATVATPRGPALGSRPAPQPMRSTTSGSRSGREPSGAMKNAPSSASRARSKRSGVSVCRVSSGSPARTSAPGLACISTPAPACTWSSLRARPAPSRQAATPTLSASSEVSTPEPGASTRWVSRATGRAASGSPPWAATIRRHTSMARPSRSASAGATSPPPAAAGISPAGTTARSTTAARPPPAPPPTHPRP